MTYLFILGRQPEIGLAELQAVFGDAKIRLIASNVAVANVDKGLAASFFSRLGSVVKAAEAVDNSWDNIAKFLPPDGKVTLGLSAYGTKLKLRDLTQIGLRIKKKRGSVRLIPSSEITLSSATVLHNKLTKGENKFEFILAQDGARQILARTIYVQDITSYALRDHGRPRRDARVGMLPPKLAQTMINLAAGQITHKSNVILLDPFCGTGVVLQEASLMGYNAYGSDLNAKMIEYTSTNLEWLKKTHRIDFSTTLEVADATDHTWQPPIDIVVTEVYLGQPFSSAPSDAKLKEVIATCDTITRKFLTNLATQINLETRLCIAVPAWFARGNVHRLPLTKSLDKLGYTTLQSSSSSTAPLIYHRENQIVGRELLVLAPKTKI